MVNAAAGFIHDKSVVVMFFHTKGKKKKQGTKLNMFAKKRMEIK